MKETINSNLYDLLNSMGFEPIIMDSVGEEVPSPETASVFEFEFRNDGKNYGTVTLTVDGNRTINLIYGKSVSESPTISKSGKSWGKFKEMLNSFAATHRAKITDSNQNRMGHDSQKRAPHSELSEAYHPVNKNTSHNDKFGNSAKIILKHSKTMEEGDQRFRHVEKIFIENANGERFLAPTTKPGLAAIYGRHIAEGGTPYDQRGTHISELITEYEKMSGFVRATKSSSYTNESISSLIEEGIKHHTTLRETLKKMTTRNGYDSYFESWSPMIIENEEIDDLTEMFKTSNLDPRIESALPIIGKLSKKISEMTEAIDLEEWADGIASDLVIPTTNQQKKAVYDIMTGEGLVVGADAQNAKNILDDIMYDSKLDDMLADLAKHDPNADVTETLKSWMEQSENGTIRGLLTAIENASSDEAAMDSEEQTDDVDTQASADDMDPSAVTDSNGDPVMQESDKKGLWSNIHAKQDRIKHGSGERMRKPGSKGAPTAKNFKDSATESVEESSPNQLKATDKMKNIGPVLGKGEKKHPADGKLVGESLAQILKLSGLKR